MGPISLLTIVLSLLPLLAAILTIVFLVRWVRERRTMKRAGVGPDSPGCGACLYLVRGWDSPHCPECGADVRERGVVIGPRIPLALKIAAITLLVVSVALPVCVVLARTLFMVHSGVAMWEAASLETPTYYLHLRTERVQRPMMTPRFRTALIVGSSASFSGIQIHRSGGEWAPPPSGNARLDIGPADDPPSPQHLELFIAKAVGTEPTPRMAEQAGVVAARISASRADLAFATPTVPASFAASPTLFRGLGSGAGNAVDLWPPAQVGMFVIPLLLALLFDIWIIRTHRRSRRAAREGEWLLASGSR